MKEFREHNFINLQEFDMTNEDLLHLTYSFPASDLLKNKKINECAFIK